MPVPALSMGLTALASYTRAGDMRTAADDEHKDPIAMYAHSLAGHAKGDAMDVNSVVMDKN